jgi:hypothetical protein
VPTAQLSEIVAGSLGGPGDTHPARLETYEREGTTYELLVRRINPVRRLLGKKSRRRKEVQAKTSLA